MKIVSKKGKLGTGIITTAIVAIISIVLLFKLYAVLMPEAMTAGDELNASGVPLGSLFVSGGMVFLIIMVALILVVVYGFLKTRGK